MNIDDLPSRLRWSNIDYNPPAFDHSGEASGEPANNSPIIEFIDRGSLLPLSFAQEHIWFASQPILANVSQQVALAISLNGGLNLPAVRMTVSEIVRRHELL